MYCKAYYDNHNMLITTERGHS